MNPDDLASDGPAPDDLARAAAQLRGRPLPRVVEIADAVLERSLRAPRRAELLRAAAPYGFVRVSSTVVTAVLRERVDAGLATAVVRRVSLDVGRDGRLEALTLELIVQYAAPIVDVADRARALTRDVLADLLGEVPATLGVRVSATHVHVGDVTVGDPHLVDPGDE